MPASRPPPDALAEAVRLIRAAERPLVVAGGGVTYAEANDELAAFADATGIPVAETQAGRGALRYDRPGAVGAIGVTGTTAANHLAREADLVLGIGTRYSDFTTASHTLFARPGVRFVNVNVAAVDAAKHAGLAVVADAREALQAFRAAPTGWSVDARYRAESAGLVDAWSSIVDEAGSLRHAPRPAQSEVIAAVNAAAGPRDVIVAAAGSLPGDLHKLWRATDPKQYHVEYGYSCMGYEIAGGLGVKLAAPDREVFVLVGDGSYLMMAQELVTAVAEGVKLIVVLVDNEGFASIGALSDTVGASGFGTWYRYRDPDTAAFDGERLPVDLAANAASLGADVIRARTVGDLRDALERAKRSQQTTVVHISTDPMVPGPASGAWWDVPVAEVSTTEDTIKARASYVAGKRGQRHHL